MSEGTIFLVHVLPFPWPPKEKRVISIIPSDKSNIRIEATDRGSLVLTVTNNYSGKSASFTSQAVAIKGDRPRPVQMAALWNASRCWLRLSGQDLLADDEAAPVFTLPALSVPAKFSFDHDEAASACQQWIANRQSKFAAAPPRKGRRSKTVDEEVETLRSSIHKLKSFRRSVVAGESFLLGSLVAELRAMIYWPPNRDTRPDNNWSPLLLRLANIGGLPLPVYSVPDVPEPSIVGKAVVHFIPASIPRVIAIFPTDKICDLQEALKKGALRIGSRPPAATISVAELIKETAVTLGAAHYDRDIPEFLDWMRDVQSAHCDEITGFMCSTAESIASLSEWVLSRLSALKVIS